MTDSANPKKRKRHTDDNDQVTLSLSEASSDAVGPVLVAFPALQPAQSTAYKYYVKRHKKSKGETQDEFCSLGGIIATETDTVEFYSAGSDNSHRSDQSCRYLVGIHDKTTNKVTLRQAPIHILKREVKALKSLDHLAVSQASDERTQARDALGEAFGSKKAKKAIRAAERNRVDVSALKGVADHLQESVNAGTASLPSQEAAKTAADESRPIPQFNVDAKSPDEIYALHNIITEAEMNSISVSKFISAPDDKQRIGLLPYSRSSWVNQHLSAACSGKPNKTNIKILFYISSMLLFRICHGDVGDKSALQKRMASVPSEMIESLLARFTEQSRDSKAYLTQQGRTRIITYMFALCLRIDHYATDPTLIATDLQMPVSSVVLHFKQLGCQHASLTTAERTQQGLGPATDKEPKRCILRVPFSLPKPRAKRRG